MIQFNSVHDEMNVQHFLYKHIYLYIKHIPYYIRYLNHIFKMAQNASTQSKQLNDQQRVSTHQLTNAAVRTTTNVTSITLIICSTDPRRRAALQSSPALSTEPSDETRHSRGARGPPPPPPAAK